MVRQCLGRDAGAIILKSALRSLFTALRLLVKRLSCVVTTVLLKDKYTYFLTKERNAQHIGGNVVKNNAQGPILPSRPGRSKSFLIKLCDEGRYFMSKGSPLGLRQRRRSGTHCCSAPAWFAELKSSSAEKYSFCERVMIFNLVR